MYGGKPLFIQVIKDKEDKDGEIPEEDGDNLASKDSQVSRDGDNLASKVSQVSRDGDNLASKVSEDNSSREDGDNRVSKDLVANSNLEDSGVSKTTTTSKCRDTNRLTTQEDGTILTIRDFSSKFNKFSRDTTPTTQVASRVKSFSRPTETSLSQWVRLPLPTNNKCSRPCSSVTLTAMAESTAWKCSTFSRECKASREDR
jgi:hypothetical protein